MNEGMTVKNEAEKNLRRLEREAVADAERATAIKRREYPNWTASGFAEDMRGLTVVSLPDWKQARAWAYWHEGEYLSRDAALALLAGEAVTA